MVQRLCLRRRMSYSTLSNKRRISKTPGGKLVYLYQKKAAKIPRCGDTGVKLQVRLMTNLTIHLSVQLSVYLSIQLSEYKTTSSLTNRDFLTFSQGIKPARPTALKNMPKRHKRVSRAYGGNLCAAAVRER